MAFPHPQGSPTGATADQMNLTVASSPLTPPMVEGNNENIMDTTDLTDTSTGEKRKREGKLRSVVWQHFTKLIREDGTCEKCKCGHCNKLFTCSSRSGTTHLLRHLTEGRCPVFKLDKKDDHALTNTINFSCSSGKTDRKRTMLLPWKFEQPLAHQPIEHSIDMANDFFIGEEGLEDLDPRTSGYPDGDLVGQSSTSAAYAKLPQQNTKGSQLSGEAWVNELRACTSKLVKLTNEQFPNSLFLKTCLAGSGPDYSLRTAIKYLNEMDDTIPESSAMYLDALDIIRDPVERECFLSLNPEPRRKWLQRTLHRRYPSRYNKDV
ncbi:unnamed protein product [Cuscuta epithymum]|uniref:BED-type domain-containing protein n=2 Tax=Cuscuta epithymum TaxID=186058 RepID=A0AAV0DLC2_9ASTE|nr:unnamed protein product [Cuscuta epithymum]CAH9143293.1 unnamed protein product [Cuscuta epithymum]